MDNSFGFFSINNTLISLWSYPLSYIELIGTIFGLLAVYLATKQKIVSWPLGLINVSCFLILFYQVQLYSGMFLQAFYFATNIYGWVIWRKQLSENSAPTILSIKNRWTIAVLATLFSVVVGVLVQKLPQISPELFPKPASQPYYDAFVAIVSIVGQIMLTRRIFENWYVWILVNAVSVFVFYRQGLYLLSIEYFLFLLIAIKGVYDWKKASNI